MIKRCCARVVLALLCLALLAIGYAAWSVYAYGGQTSALQADAAVVLGAEIYGGQPSPVFRERINHGIELYKSGYVRRIVFTGGPDAPNGPPEAKVAARYAIAQGIPEEDIVIEDRSETTEENLLFVRQLLAGEGARRVLIVSDPLHMKRAMTIAYDLHMDAFPSPTPTTMYRALGNQLNMLFRETLSISPTLSVARLHRTHPKTSWQGVQNE